MANKSEHPEHPGTTLTREQVEKIEAWAGGSPFPIAIDGSVVSALASFWLATQWQPIETAPRDGMWLAVRPDGHMCVMSGTIYWRQKESPHMSPAHLQFHLTHWQPLPPPPKVSE